MTATAHALIGGAIAATIQNPQAGIALAFISHPIADMIPHWDFAADWRSKNKVKLFLEASLDLGTGLVVAYALFGRDVDIIYFFSCIFASEIWDIVESPYWLLNWKFPPITWVYNIQSKLQGKLAAPWGIITQILFVALLYIILKNF